MNVERRKFIKKACGVCGALLGVSAVLPVLNGCSSLQSYETSVKSGKVFVPLAKFSNDNNLLLLKSPYWEFDVAVTKLSELSFRAFYMECTHQSTGLVATKNGFFCSAHGSSFSIEGRVKTPPATKNLKEFPVEILGSEICITV